MLFITEGLESEAKFNEAYDNQTIDLKQFIRSIVGLDCAAAKTAFSQYLENTHFTVNQICFVEKIIDLLTQQDTMDSRLLYEPPFTDFH